MDFDFAHFMVTGGKVEKGSDFPCSSAKEAYRKLLADTFNINRTRILAFKNKPPPSFRVLQEHLPPISQPKSAKKRRRIPQLAERILDAPDITDDFYLNLLDWSCCNVIVIALGNAVYLWDASSGSASEFITCEDDLGPVTSVRWAPDGRHLAIGLNNSSIQLWDSQSGRMLRTLHGKQDT